MTVGLSDPSEPQPPTRTEDPPAVPGYRLGRLLAQTSWTRTHEAHAERSGEPAVVKIVTPSSHTDDAFTQRLLRDNRVVAGLRQHRHLARVLDVGSAPRGAWVAVEFISGVPLHRRVADVGRFTIAEALRMVRDAARALEALSTAGVVHRNIQSSSLYLLPDGTTQVTDAGFSAPLDALGGPSGVRGAAAYMAPELLTGHAPDLRSDMYALGATLFELMTGRALFLGSTADVLAAHQKKPVPSIATLVPEAGIVVVDALYRLLQKDPARRPGSGAELVQMLEDALARTLRASSTTLAPAAQTSMAPTGASVSSTIPQPASVAARICSQTLEPEAPSSNFGAPDLQGTPYAPAPSGVVGMLRQMSVAEIAQMLELGKKSARVDIQTIDNVTATIHVHDGQLVHARAGLHTGEAAITALLRKKDGTFRIHYDKEPCIRNIERPTTFVLLDAMRQIDERPTPTGQTDLSTLPSRTAPSDADPTLVTHPPIAAESDVSEVSTSAIVTRSSTFSGFSSGRSLEDTASRADADAGLEDTASGTTRSAVTSTRFRDRARDTLSFSREGFELSMRWMRRVQHEAEARCAPMLAHVWPHVVRVQPRLSALRPTQVMWAACAVGMAVVVVLVGALMWARTSSEPMARILAGQASSVIDELGKKGMARRTPEETLALAHAHAVVGDDDNALWLYGHALAAGAADGLAMDFLASRLDASAPDEELDLLIQWPDDALEDVLEILALDPDRYMRSNAVGVLVERGALGRIHVEQVAILDVQQGGCGMRRWAAQILRDVGRTRGAMAAVTRGAESSARCLNGADLREVRTAIERRLSSANAAY